MKRFLSQFGYIISMILMVPTLSLAKEFLPEEISSQNGTEHALPLPTGPYQVGIKAFDLFDTDRKEIEYPEGRLVPILIYFPKNRGPHELHPKKLDERASDSFNIIPIWKKLQIKIYGKYEQDLSYLKNSGQHPLVIMNHGNGCLMTDLGFIAEDLASHGYIVVTIQHQLKTDRKLSHAWEIRMMDRYSTVINNIFFVFEWLKQNNGTQFFGSVDLKRVGLIGQSQGAHSLILLAERIGERKDKETLLPHESSENVKECIITFAGDYAFPYFHNNRYPLLLLIGEDKEVHYKETGQDLEMKKFGHQTICYPHARRESFVEHTYFGIENSFSLGTSWFNGTWEERKEFFNKVRKDIRTYLQEKIGKVSL